MKPRPCFLFNVLSSLLLQLHTKESIQTSALFSVLNTLKLWGEAGGGKNAQSNEQEPTFSEPVHCKNKGAEEKIGLPRGILVGFFYIFF